MKVVCVNNIYDKPLNRTKWNMDLTIGKVYDVIATDNMWRECVYKIMNDEGSTSYYSHGRFVIPLDEYRQKQLEILEHEI